MTLMPLAADERSAGERLVQKLYQQFAWEAVMGGPDFREPGLLDQPKAVLEQFFTPEIAALLLKDRAEAAAAGEVGRIDFLPLWYSQDPGASQLSVAAGSQPDAVTVSFLAGGENERTVLVFRLEETPAGVRIADIQYPGGLSFAGLLQLDN